MGEVVVCSGQEVIEVEESKNKAVTAAVMEEEEEEPEVGKWEKLLPRMKLRVLLVEADDSTRQIIAALLRKCSYRVAAVSDGLMAWEALKSQPHNIDLILTEVELPLISGYALLTLAVEHDICKNIPVIMMSSQDTVSMVLRCMLKGAADFLIKPVRRNELRNLWQHVWRRRTLSAGLVIENTPMAQEKIEGTSENNAASNRSSACATVSRNNEESDKRKSDTPDFVELRSSNALNISNTDAASYKDMVKMDNRSVSPDNESTERSNCLGKEDPSVCGTLTGEGNASAKISVQDEVMRQGNDRGSSEIPPGHNNENVESSNGAIDLIGKFGGYQKGTYEQPNVNDGKSKFEFAPHLELSLRRFGASNCNSKNQGVNERCGLNHSNASAFSRYNSIKASEPYLPLLSHNYDEFQDKSHNFREQLQNVSEKQHGAGFGDREEIATALGIGQSGHSQLAYPTPQIGMFPVSRVRLNNYDSGFSPNVSPIYDAQSGLVRTWSLALAGQASPSPHPTSASVHSNFEILSNSEQNHRQSDEATNNSVERHVYQQNNITGQRLRNSPSVAVHSTGSSQCNGFQNHNDSNAYGCSVSRNNGASSTPPVDKSITADNLKDGNQLIRGGSSEMDAYRSSQREAALQKFRLKRKDRCYEKKVRYQSRKKLAEQRPRVKGQFVRQNDPLISDAKV